jgi:WD40 repeat protein
MRARRIVLWSLMTLLVWPASALAQTENKEPHRKGRQFEPHADPERTAAKDQPARADLYGDALPEGALARLGTIRCRHEGLSAVGFGPEGKTLLTYGADGTVRVWDVATGKELRRLGSTPKPPPGSPQEDMAILRSETIARLGGRYGALAISEDRQLVAASSSPGSITLWEVGAGNEVRQFTATGSEKTYLPFVPLAFSPDRKYLLAGQTEGLIGNNALVLYLFDVATGKEVHRYRQTGSDGERLYIQAPLAAFSRDGKRITVVQSIRPSPDFLTRATVWELDTGKELLNLQAPPEVHFAQALSPDGSVVAGGGLRGSLVLWDVKRNEIIRRLNETGHQIRTAVKFAPAGDAVAIWDGTTVSLIDAATGKERQSLSDQRAPADRERTVRAEVVFRSVLAFSPDGTRLAVGKGTNALSVWELAGGKRLGPAAGHQGAVTAVALGPDGRRATTLGEDGTVRQWEVAGGKEIRQQTLPASHVDGAISSDGRLAAFPVALAAIHLMEVATGRILCRLEDGQSGATVLVQHLAIAPDGRTLAAKKRNGAVNFMDVATGKVRFRTDNQGKGEHLLTLYLDRSPFTFSADSRLAAVVDLDEQEAKDAADPATRFLGRNLRSTIRLLDAATGRVVRCFDQQTGQISALAFSPDGRSLGAVNADNTLCLWETATGKPRLHFKGSLLRRQNALKCLAFGPEGRRLATGGDDRIVRLWDLATGQEVSHFAGHDGAVLSVAFTSDRKTLVSASGDGTALVWQLRKEPSATEPLDAADVERLWRDLQAEDASKAYQAVCALSADPARTVALLRHEIRPAPAPDSKRIAQLIADLDNNQFEAREKANQELDKLGKAAEPVLRQALTGDLSVEVRRRLEHVLARPEEPPSTPESIRLLRAVEVLERIGSPEAKEVLRSLAKGAVGHLLTREAKVTLERLHATRSAKP